MAQQNLKNSTAGQEALFGPFLDETDGITPLTGLTIANTDVKLWKRGGTTESNKNSGGLTHIAGGRYYGVLDATDSDTVGEMEANIHVSGALPVKRTFDVLPAPVYDALYTGTPIDSTLADGAITAAKIAADAITATKIATDALTQTKFSQIYRGTVDAGSFSTTTTEFESDDITTAAADHWNGRVVIFTSGTLAGQARTITDYAKVGSNGHFTCDAFTSIPADNSTFIIV